MPLLQFYHAPGAFSAADKKAIAEGMVNTVYAHLPSFYVNVHFITIDPENHYIGGISRDNYVRIVIEHIASHLDPKKRDPEPVKNAIDAVIKPYVGDRGLDWEYGVLFGEQHLWRINGINPPLIDDKEVLAEWAAAGKAIPRA
jgi:phenylpyruvate tautomerase PptA (4-oxalocrotonate tautomerase family)